MSTRFLFKFLLRFFFCINRKAKSTPHKARESSESTSSIDESIPSTQCDNESSVACENSATKSLETARLASSEIETPKVHATNTKTIVKRRKVIAKQKTATRPEQKQQPLTQQRARGTLHGLSTLRRHGNVRVSKQNDYIAVRSNFVLGPLVLKVEKPFGRGVKREVKRATATTTQMIGRINLRIVNDKATLHSIKVQQPKQVKIEKKWQLPLQLFC